MARSDAGRSRLAQSGRERLRLPPVSACWSSRCACSPSVLHALCTGKSPPWRRRAQLRPLAAPQPQKKPEEPQSGKHALAEPLKLRALAFAELDEAAAFFEDCGSINKGFAGCNFAFSDEVSRYYEGIAQAADDGFAVTLKAREGNPDRERCEVLELAGRPHPA